MTKLSIIALTAIAFGCAPVAPTDTTNTNTTPSAQPHVAAPSLPQLKPDQRSPMLVPVGWTVKVATKNDVSVLRIDQQPGHARSPMLGMLGMKVSAGATPANLLRRVSGNMKVARVINQRTFANGGGFLLVEGTVGNIPAKMAAISAGNNNQVYAAFFVAPTARFHALGGSRLLLASLRMNTLPPAVAPVRRQPVANNVDVFSYKGQLRLLAARQRVAPATIVGKWSQGIGVPMGDVYTSVTTGRFSYDTLGHGNMFEFRADGRYAWIHNYSQQYRSCRNTVKASETGSYRFDGMTLIMTPSNVDANLCACCTKPTKMTRTVPKQRVFQVAVHPGKNHLVLRGTCPAYMISCVGNAPKFMREGLARGK